MHRLNTTDTRERLLATAVDLISRESYGAVSVDDICKKAGAQKGSFYHFFPSKCDLAMAALEEHWEKKLRPELDRIFSPETAPVDRLAGLFEYTYRMHKEKAERFGFVAGCPYSSVGVEQSTQDQKLRQGIERILNLQNRYVESALRDAVARRQIPECDAKEKTREIFAYYMGTVMQAKIANSLEPLSVKKMKSVIFTMIGYRAAGKTAALQK